MKNPELLLFTLSACFSTSTISHIFSLLIYVRIFLILGSGEFVHTIGAALLKINNDSILVQIFDYQKEEFNLSR